MQADGVVAADAESEAARGAEGHLHRGLPVLAALHRAGANYTGELDRCATWARLECYNPVGLERPASRDEWHHALRMQFFGFNS